MSSFVKRATAGAALCAFAACSPQAPRQSSGVPSPSASSLPPLQIAGRGTATQPLRIIQSRGNRKEYLILAHSLHGNTNGAGAPGTLSATLYDAHVTFYAADGNTLIADAPRALIDQRAKTVILLGGVHARNGAGVRLQCDRLVYDRTTQLVHGTGHVKITSPDGTQATGSTVVSNVTLTSATMQ
jgi:hypothetical protein